MAGNRARDLSFVAPRLLAGEHDAITDVGDVRVGHTTLIEGDGPLRVGEGPVRTGVTAVLPHGGDLFLEKVPAAVHTINGFGKPHGFEQVRELGVIESPIALTNTLNVGLVSDALVQHAVRRGEAAGYAVRSVNVLVGETNDGHLNDIQGRHVRAEHVWAAIDSAASGPVAEGCAGAGTGTICFGWKGGIGTASRVVPEASGGFTVGALVQANFGRAGDLVVRGFPVGQWLQAARVEREEAGSVMVVLATDAPLTSRQLGRLCRRVPAGLARLGATLSHGSGDFVVAFSTARTILHQPPSLTATATFVADEARVVNALFVAAVESVEEAVLNALCAAETMTGRDGHRVEALPVAGLAARIARLDAGGGA